MRKFILTLLVLLTPLLFAVPVFAKETGEHIVLDTNEVIDKDYFAAGEAVSILGTVNGDAYIAGGNITVDGTINGDLLVGGGNVTIRGTVANDIRAAGGQVSVLGNVGGNVTIAGGTVMLAPTAQVEGSVVLAGGDISLGGPVGRGATLAGGQVTTSSSIGGDVWAGVGNLFVATGTNVSGNLHYISDTEATIATGAIIAGETMREIPPSYSEEKEDATKAFLGFAFWFKTMNLLSALLLGLLLLKFAPRFMKETSDTLGVNTWRALGVGLLTYVLLPFICVILLISVLGIPFALILLALVFILSYASKVVACLFIGQWILTKVHSKYGLGTALLIGFLVYFVLTLIPFINFLAWLFVLFAGTGALLLTKKKVYKELRSKNSI